MSELIEFLVVSYDSSAAIEQLLTSLAVTAPRVPVAIREHAPDAEAVRRLKVFAVGHPAPVRIEHDPSNPGFGAGCNALAAGSAARFIAFLNPDTEMVTWPWSDDAPPPAGAIIGPLMSEAAHQHFGRSYRIRDEIALSWFRRRPLPPDGTGYVSGAALLIERQAFQRIGGFDERLFLFYEDIDLCLRANQAGVRTEVERRWTMHHARGHSTGSRFGAALMWSYESACTFYAEHGSPVWTYRLYKLVDALGRAAVHAIRRSGQARAYVALARRALSG